MNEEKLTCAEEMPQLMLEHQLCFPLYAAARRVVNQYTPYLKPLRLTYTQYIVFLALWEAGERTVGELCRTLYLDNGTLTPLLKKMEESGYIRRVRSEADERIVTVRLTEEGWAMRRRAAEIPGQVGKCVALSSGDAAALYTLLYKVLNQLEEPLRNTEGKVG